mmetsp:Transcript_9973/g.13867  ORF Transcript_9973/g.13867 Transcript_9973/m.13867 type:complete len:680 (-) Transcript_9973:413-2452(-)
MIRGKSTGWSPGSKCAAVVALLVAVAMLAASWVGFEQRAKPSSPLHTGLVRSSKSFYKRTSGVSRAFPPVFHRTSPESLTPSIGTFSASSLSTFSRSILPSVPARSTAKASFNYKADSEALGSSSSTASSSSVSSERIADSKEYQALLHHAATPMPHLRELIQDEKRCDKLVAETNGVFMDFSRQKMTAETLNLLLNLAREAGVAEKIQKMGHGETMNPTENRAVLHTALRCEEGEECELTEVISVINRIEDFSARVRSGEWSGATGKALKNVVAIGIGGSYLGAEFVAEALHSDPMGREGSDGRRLRFLANIDPVGVDRALEGLDPEETLVVVISKTFTTAETMLNARTVRQWLRDAMGHDSEETVSKHMVAVSTNHEKCVEFGIAPENIFIFWDWVGGRYSVTSAVGLLPLSLAYGMDVVRQFLRGARSVDRHFMEAPIEKNLPVLLGLIAVWQSTFQGYATRALIPYAQALAKFAPHVQQISMESNGKSVSTCGSAIPYECAEIEFGEPGTNAQHSFFQLLHQGREVPVDFIGFKHSQTPIELPGEVVSNHDELMANFFAQPDALALGRTDEELRSLATEEELIPHKRMPGNRPSTILLFDELNAYTIGQLLALYEHRIAVQGFIWGINSFDQYGVELGKELGKTVRNQIAASRKDGKDVSGFNPSTTRLLKRYLD